MYMNNRAADKATMDNIKYEGLKKRYSIKRSSPCRRSTNLFSYYFSELDGLSVILRILIVMLYLKKKKLTNKLEIALIVIIILHTLLHSIIIIASLPPFCDSSNIEWVPDSNTTIGKIFDIFHCHYKHNLYYSDVFMLSGITPPLLLLLSLLYKSR
jgi:hypothetical protein